MIYFFLEEESVGMLVSSPNAVQALASFPATGLKNFGVLDEEDKASPSKFLFPLKFDCFSWNCTHILRLLSGSFGVVVLLLL